MSSALFAGGNFRMPAGCQVINNNGASQRRSHPNRSLTDVIGPLREGRQICLETNPCRFFFFFFLSRVASLELRGLSLSSRLR